MNPIDQAKGILSFIQAKHPDKGYGMDGVMSELVMYNRRPEDLPEEIATTFVAISKIAAKSISTLFNIISLLKLSPEIQAEIQAGNLPVSQGYLFAANLDCPDIHRHYKNTSDLYNFREQTHSIQKSKT
ncbi:MAG: hypothetical protein NT178_11335 [Proteobacteria bacterium]|nr:hypothetical protein [Pseudomonadota bacterium]